MQENPRDLNEQRNEEKRWIEDDPIQLGWHRFKGFYIHTYIYIFQSMASFVFDVHGPYDVFHPSQGPDFPIFFHGRFPK